jgi:ribosomal protein L16 Arg81 hydroxylase
LFPGDRFAEFVSLHFLKSPLAVPGGCASLIEYATWETLGKLLADDMSDVVVGAGGEQAAVETPRSLDAANSILDAGWTIGIRHAQRCDDRLAALAAAFRETFRSEVDVQLYCTPAGQHGFGWHYDAEDVFVLQSVGQKTWWLRKNTVNPWPLIDALPENMQYEREIMPAMRCHLHPGDWLYVPAGYWHRTEAEESSISLSVGILPATALDLFDFLRRDLAHSLVWRQRLPYDDRSVTGRAEHAAILMNLARDFEIRLRDPKLIERFLDSRP